MTWRGDQLSRIAGSEELQISTRRLDGTQRRDAGDRGNAARRPVVTKGMPS